MSYHLIDTKNGHAVLGTYPTRRKAFNAAEKIEPQDPHAFAPRFLIRAGNPIERVLDTLPAASRETLATILRTTAHRPMFSGDLAEGRKQTAIRRSIR